MAASAVRLACAGNRVQPACAAERESATAGMPLSSSGLDAGARTLASRMVDAAIGGVAD